MGKNCNQQLEPSGVILGKSTRVLGKVVLTPEGSYDATRDYDYLCLVYDEFTKSSFISKKQVPAGTPLSNDEYWQPINNNSEVSTFSTQLISLNNIGSPSRDSILVWDTTNNTFEWVDKPYSKAEVDNKFDDVQSTLDFDSTPTAGSLNPVTSDGIKRYVDAHQPDLSGKQDVISDLAAIRSGAALGTTAVQTETDPTVPAWAKTSTKPSYTAQEVGALPADTQFMNINGANVKSNNSINVYTQTAADSRFASKTELSGYATETYVNNALVNVVYAGEDVGSANSEGDGEGSGDVTPSGDYVTTSDFNAAMLTKANDNAVVHKTGSETISGEKNFNDRILLHSTIAREQEPVEGEEQTNTTEDTVLSGSYIYHQGHADFSWITTSVDEEVDVDDSISLQSALDKKVSTSSNRLLPAVTSANNNKILKVVNGTWTLADDATSAGGSGVDSTAVHQTGNETVDGVKRLIGTLAVEDGRGGQISCTDLDNFDWIVVRGGTTLQSVLTAMTNRIAALETKLASIYSYDSSTNTLTINDPNGNS